MTQQDDFLRSFHLAHPTHLNIPISYPHLHVGRFDIKITSLPSFKKKNMGDEAKPGVP
jgi:hypothetical protein